MAIPALEAAGWTVETIPWRSAEDWSRFEVVVVRSTWDYWDDPDAFLAVLEQISAATCLANPIALLRWNLSKTYLRTLHASGVPIVPTHWVKALRPEDLSEAAKAFPRPGWVIKPQVGASGIDAFCFRGVLQDPEPAEVLDRLAGQAVMIQPFRERVLQEGEFSLFYFDGKLSHGIRKVPAPEEFRTQEERGAQILLESVPEDFRVLAEQALEVCPERPLYARIDVIRNDQGRGEIMELELVEPSLYFRMDEQSPQRFARALEQWLLSPA